MAEEFDVIGGGTFRVLNGTVGGGPSCATTSRYEWQ
jgi:hypothetical protein